MTTKALDVQVGGGHYKDFPIQPVEFCQRNKLGFCESSVVKYVSRHKSKNGLQDLQKAKHFIDMLIELEYSTSKSKEEEQAPREWFVWEPDIKETSANGIPMWDKSWPIVDSLEPNGMSPGKWIKVREVL